jgi:hypothetical protein
MEVKRSSETSVDIYQTARRMTAVRTDNLVQSSNSLRNAVSRQLCIMQEPHSQSIMGELLEGGPVSGRRGWNCYVCRRGWLTHLPTEKNEPVLTQLPSSGYSAPSFCTQMSHMDVKKIRSHLLTLVGPNVSQRRTVVSIFQNDGLWSSILYAYIEAYLPLPSLRGAPIYNKSQHSGIEMH